MMRAPVFREWRTVEPAARAGYGAATRRCALRFNDDLHAFVEIVHAASSEAAGPLAGLPYAAKDLFVVPGRSPRCGLSAPPQRFDGYAEAMRRLDATGAVLAGFTAMTELAYEPSGYSAVGARAYNPWNRDFAPGGSSSGSAIAVACGAAVVALGSDTAGSIRIPAHCCGVTGWKPSHGAVSAAGAMPLAPFLDSVGLLARCAADLAPAADVLLTTHHATEEVASIAVIADAMEEAEPAVRRACDDAIDVCGSLGLRLTAVDALPAIATIDEYALIVLQAEAARNHASLLGDTTLDDGLRKRLGKGLAISDDALSSARLKRDSLVEHFFAGALHGADVAVLPVMPICTPAYAEVDPTSTSFNARGLYALSRYCRFVNMLGAPSIAVPVGLDDRGLPVAMQIIGRPGRDRDLIQMAIRLQERSDWHGRVPTTIRDALSGEKELMA